MAGGGGNYAATGMAGTGAILGGIGDIIQAQNYHQPKLDPATGMEQRLRQLAQSQLLGGGQQLLGATALYNQLAPILMSQLPGMSYVPGGGGGGDTGGGGSMQPGGGGGGGLGSYADQLQQLQESQNRQQQLIDLKAQRAGAKKGQKGQYKQQIKSLKREIKSNPTVAQMERRAYTSGMQPGAYDVRMGGSGGAQGPQSGGPPSTQSSLGSINDLLASLQGGGAHPDLLSIYRGAGGY